MSPRRTGVMADARPDAEVPAAPPDFALSESPRYVGRAVAAMADDPDRAAGTRRRSFPGSWPRLRVHRSRRLPGRHLAGHRSDATDRPTETRRCGPVGLTDGPVARPMPRQHGPDSVDPPGPTLALGTDPGVRVGPEDLRCEERDHGDRRRGRRSGDQRLPCRTGGSIDRRKGVERTAWTAWLSMVTTVGERGVQRSHAPFDGGLVGEVPVCESDAAEAARRARPRPAGLGSPSCRRTVRGDAAVPRPRARPPSSAPRPGPDRDGKAVAQPPGGVPRRGRDRPLLRPRGPSAPAPLPSSGCRAPLLTRTVVHHPPEGLVGVISPWNYPLTLAVSDAVPALLAGNGIILKPDSQHPVHRGRRWSSSSSRPASPTTCSGSSLARGRASAARSSRRSITSCSPA